MIAKLEILPEQREIGQGSMRQDEGGGGCCGGVGRAEAPFNFFFEIKSGQSNDTKRELGV